MKSKKMKMRRATARKIQTINPAESVMNDQHEMIEANSSVVRPGRFPLVLCAGLLCSIIPMRSSGGKTAMQ